jgi:cellulose synthase/poly-beta-1,6-N-acetylglucosamine synthase-like glycosyltransferase
MLPFLHSLPVAQLILLIVTAVALVGLLFYYLFFFLRLAISKEGNAENEEMIPVSVIICARNEAGNIIKNLPYILKQDYPEFEVIVVNDSSWDGTDDELREIQVTHPNLQVVTIGEDIQRRPGKKFPLTLGIKKARNELLVFTDADCRPESSQWLKQMVSGFSGGKDVVIGVSPFLPAPGVLNALARFENLLTGTFYLSFALAGFPYMGVGRNLAYRRSAYDRVGGFKTHYHIISGDDDLLVRDMASKGNTSVVLNHQALMWSEAALSWKNWWRQKRRHYSTSAHYRTGTKLMLGLYPMMVVVFFVGAIALLVYENLQHISLAMLGLKIVAQLAIFRGAFRVQKDRWIWLFSPVFELLLVINQLALMLAAVFSKQRKWE